MEQSGKLKRPTSVTVISWVLFANSVLGILGIIIIAVAIEFNPEFLLILCSTFASCILFFVIGVGLLNGHNWARLTFLWLLIPLMIVGSFIRILNRDMFPTSFFLILVLCIVFPIFLNRPNVITYFRRGATDIQGDNKAEDNLAS